MKITKLIIIRLISILFRIKTVDIVRFINDVESLRKKSGIVYTIRYMKTCRLHVTRWMCRKPLKVNKDLVSLTNDFFPKKFLYLKKYMNSHIGLRGVLTLFYYTRSIRPTSAESKKIKPDFSSITDKRKSVRNYTIPLPFIKEFVKSNKLRLAVPTYSNELHYLSTKSSPYGKSTISAAYSLFSFSQIHHNLLNYFLNILGQSEYMEIIGNLIKDTWEDNRVFHFFKENGHAGKLSVINDPELKLRVIAMLDYPSQFILRPIHDGLFTLLGKLPQDRTFTQDPFNKWELKGNHFHSLDLSSATDRFPIDLQQKLLSVIYEDNDFSLNWRNILVDRSFAYEGNIYKYAVGQPMGAYSSWAAFTLSHHLVVHWAYHLCGINPDSYIILGDDIVIANDKVANKYRGIMEKLGVDISIAKTHVSKNTYEFAKRWVKNRVEISPLPLRGIISNYKNLNVVLMQLINYLNKNNTYFEGGALDLMKNVYQNLKVNKVYLSNKSINKICYIFYHSYRYSIGLSTNREMRIFLTNILPDFIPVPSDEIIPGFIRDLLIKSLTIEVEKLGSAVSSQFNAFVEYYKDKGLDMGMTKNLPVLHGLYNKLAKSQKSLQKLGEKSNLDLIDNIVHMRIEDVSKLLTDFRDPSFKVMKLDKLWTNTIKILKDINLEFDSHHYRAPTFEDGIFGNEINESYFKSCMSDPKGKLDVLRYGIYDDPNKESFTSDNINDYI